MDYRKIRGLLSEAAMVLGGQGPGHHRLVTRLLDAEAELYKEQEAGSRRVNVLVVSSLSPRLDGLPGGMIGDGDAPEVRERAVAREMEEELPKFGKRRRPDGT